MDAKTSAVLGKISANIPSELANNVTTKEIDTSEEQVAVVALNDKRISEEGKEKIRAELEAGRLRKENDVENEEAIQKIDEYNTQEVKRAIEQGALADPMSDPFYKERFERSQRIASGAEAPRSSPTLSTSDKQEAARRISFDRSSDPHKRKFY